MPVLGGAEVGQKGYSPNSTHLLEPQSDEWQIGRGSHQKWSVTSGVDPLSSSLETSENTHQEGTGTSRKGDWEVI